MFSRTRALGLILLLMYVWTDLKLGDEHPPTLLIGYGTLYLTLLTLVCSLYHLAKEWIWCRVDVV